MNRNLQRVTALVALVYSLAAMGTALSAWYTQHRWEQRVAAAPVTAEVSRLLREEGPQQAEPALTELVRSLNWNVGYITESSGGAPDDWRIVAASEDVLKGSTWSQVDDLMAIDSRLWHGTVQPAYTGPNGKTYVVWAAIHRARVAWPLEHQISLVTAVAAWLAIATWVIMDEPGLGWSLLAVLTGPVGLAVWLVARPTRAPHGYLICPGCGNDVPANAGVCRVCGFAVQPVCPGCGRPVPLAALQCKHCGAPLDETDPPEGVAHNET